MSPLNPASIAIIICSTRNPRFCPQVAAFVQDTLAVSSTSETLPPYKLHLIDLADWKLPFLDEPELAAAVRNPSDYVHAHTRAWSAEIQKHDAFIFVTPQYNWGMTAVSKNAIDFLFHEWVGKSSMIVSYGGHGGGKAAAAFRTVMGGVRMTCAETMPALSFGSMEVTGKAAHANDFHLLEDGSMWADQRVEIRQAFEELMVLVAERQKATVSE